MGAHRGVAAAGAGLLAGGELELVDVSDAGEIVEQREHLGAVDVAADGPALPVGPAAQGIEEARERGARVVGQPGSSASALGWSRARTETVV